MFHRYASPAAFARLSTTLAPLFMVAAMGFLSYGLYLALVASPPDYQQGETVRIMYVHVPAAWLSMAIYGFMACCSVSWLIWRHPLADVLARCCAPVGCGFTLMVLVTGSLWGKPMWGAWWVWDARLTSVLLLFFLYLAYLMMIADEAIDNRARNRAAVLSLLGAINLPIIKFSVEWWNTLHQPASVLRLGGPTIHHDLLVPLLMMFAGYVCFAVVCVLWRVQALQYQQKWRRIQLQKLVPSTTPAAPSQGA